MPLRRFEEALDADGVPLGVSYPSLSDLEVFRSHNFAPGARGLGAGARFRESAPARRRARRGLDGLDEHRILLAERERVLRVAEAAARIQEHAAEIMEKLPIGAGA